MSLLTNVRHCAVGRLSDRVVVANYVHCNQGGMPARFHAVVDKVLRSNRIMDHPRLTITDKEVGTLHYITDRLAIYIVITSPEYPQRTAFKLLDELKARFTTNFGDVLVEATENGLTSKAKRTMLDLCALYDDIARVDKTHGVQAQVDEVKGLMHENITHLLATHENLEVLEDKTDALRTEAQTFQRQATDLKRVMLWRNLKLKLIIVVIVLCVVGYVTVPMIHKAVLASQALSNKNKPASKPAASNTTASNATGDTSNSTKT
ncbi:synaptobrevin-domain-containing protein [Pavlovales sp. CCMP2436]|nr:synaptobrevin-domain-containing protein [Pavlovales sp. CCMP2436]|mmetsp:Transcript_23329/g.59188  ORF Transcript_23329/g.59188 Transcript_23329/m.59188 type:complete len:263 (-) Transcript_23329:21-809(-)